jgi:branched-chain amino acid transport system permease protein
MMTREGTFNLVLSMLLLAGPLVADNLGEPFYVTLATRVAILALAAVGLNIALGLGGLVSFGHAAFFGIGGYVAVILAVHAFNMEPLAFGFPGTKWMPVIWLAATVLCALVALPMGAISLRTSGVYFIMITLAFAQMVFYFAISWPAYGGEDGLSFCVTRASGPRWRRLGKTTCGWRPSESGHFRSGSRVSSSRPRSPALPAPCSRTSTASSVLPCCPGRCPANS